MKLLRRLGAAALCLLLLAGMALPCLGAFTYKEKEPNETTVLFTHDLHSHFLPQRGSDGGESGGYARLASALARERAAHPDALTLDGGDFSIGSLIQTLYTTQAAELRTMGAMGYDAATAGNHEFDHEGTGFASMLQAAFASGERVPALLMANCRPADSNPDQLEIQRAMSVYGVQESMLLERGGITYGIFGLMGLDSDDCAPTSGFALEEPAAAAARCVAALKEQGAQFIICLSHSGTSEDKKTSEDEQLAQAVEGIDLIISGHTHTTLTEPIRVGNTYIVSAGPYCQNLGSVTIQWDDKGTRTLADYHLTPIDETLPDDPQIAALVEEWKEQVSGEYLGRYGLEYDQVLTTSEFDLLTPTSGVQEGNSLGELAADSILWTVEHLEADAPDVDTVAVTADGVLRAPLYAGDLTTSMAFDVLSMGVGADGTSGYPLVAVYLTGKELKAAAEVDASVTPIMPAAQLYISGMSYAFNTHRMFFNRVYQANLCEAPFVLNFQGSGLARIEDGKLYRVVAGRYIAEMLGTVKGKSMGLLSLEPKNADGTPVTDFETCILRDQFGNEIKEWYALAAYLASFGENGVPEWYARPDGRKTVSRSWNPITLLRSPNWITLAAAAVVIIAALIVVAVVRTVLRVKRRRRYGEGTANYRG